MNALSIGTVARMAAVGVETIRFYERQGLIPQPPRRASGYRQYPSGAVSRVRFIRRAKQLGFALNQIKELLALWDDPGATCQDVRQRAEAKITDIEQRIASLQRMKQALKKLTAACRAKGAVAGCPILDALDGRSQA